VCHLQLPYLFLRGKLLLLLLLLVLQFNEWYRPDCMLDFPIGGSQAMVQALIR
jgi:hypothetical protein